jgi:hypothetical protein
LLVAGEEHKSLLPATSNQQPCSGLTNLSPNFLIERDARTDYFPPGIALVLPWDPVMTPRVEISSDVSHQTKPSSTRDLTLHGKPNWIGASFFAAMAALHAVIAFRAFPASHWESLISAFLASCFLLVADLSLLSRHWIIIRPRMRCIHLHSGFGRFSTDRDLPFAVVRAVRVTLWQTRRGQRSRVEILCDGEEIPCPATVIPRQEALYLALVMNVPLVKIINDVSPHVLPWKRARAASPDAPGLSAKV